MLITLVGAVNFRSVVAPNLPSWVWWLEQLFRLTLAFSTTGFLVLEQQSAVNQMLLTMDNAGLEPQLGFRASLSIQFI